MNTSSIVRTFAIAVIAMFGLASVSEAQDMQEAPHSHKAQISTTLQFNASNEKSTAMSIERVRDITQTSMQQAIAKQLDAITPELVGAKLNESFDALVAGQRVGFTTTLSSNSKTVSQQTAISVEVAYEARPIGGILSVKVQLVPAFNGIGAAARPMASREVTESVDNLDTDAVNGVVSLLAQQLGEQFAAR